MWCDGRYDTTMWLDRVTMMVKLIKMFIIVHIIQIVNRTGATFDPRVYKSHVSTPGHCAERNILRLGSKFHVLHTSLCFENPTEPWSHGYYPQRYVDEFSEHWHLILVHTLLQPLSAQHSKGQTPSILTKLFHRCRHPGRLQSATCLHSHKSGLRDFRSRKWLSSGNFWSTEPTAPSTKFTDRHFGTRKERGCGR